MQLRPRCRHVVEFLPWKSLGEAWRHGPLSRSIVDLTTTVHLAGPLGPPTRRQAQHQVQRQARHQAQRQARRQAQHQAHRQARVCSKVFLGGCQQKLEEVRMCTVIVFSIDSRLLPLRQPFLPSCRSFEYLPPPPPYPPPPSATRFSSETTVRVVVLGGGARPLAGTPRPEPSAAPRPGPS